MEAFPRAAPPSANPRLRKGSVRLAANIRFAKPAGFERELCHPPFGPFRSPCKGVCKVLAQVQMGHRRDTKFVSNPVRSSSACESNSFPEVDHWWIRAPSRRVEEYALDE